jgi:hypothetical protein
MITTKKIILRNKKGKVVFCIGGDDKVKKMFFNRPNIPANSFLYFIAQINGAIEIQGSNPNNCMNLTQYGFRFTLYSKQVHLTESPSQIKKPVASLKPLTPEVSSTSTSKSMSECNSSAQPFNETKNDSHQNNEC